jgi:predicted secreted protein
VRARRRRVVTIVASVVAAVLLLAAAGWLFRVQLLYLIPTPPVIVTERDQDKTVHLLQGQNLEVRLKTNQFSGSVWQVGMPLSFLRQRSDISFTPDSKPAHVGDGYDSISFFAAERGEGPLFIDLVPEDNQNTLNPEKSFRILVDVR